MLWLCFYSLDRSESRYQLSGLFSIVITPRNTYSVPSNDRMKTQELFQLHIDIDEFLAIFEVKFPDIYQYRSGIKGL